MGEAHGHEGVDLVVGREGEHAADAEEVELLGGMTVEHVRAGGRELGHARRHHVASVHVHQADLEAFLLECLAHVASPRVGADEQEPLRVRDRQSELAREGARRQAVDHDGADDDEERQRDERLRTGYAARLEREAEHGRDRGGHDAARAHPREEDLLLLGEGGAARAHPDRDGAHHEQQRQQEQEPAAVEAAELVVAEPRRQQDEQARDEQHAQVLLELEDVTDGHAAVRGPDTHDRDGKQAALVLARVRQDECTHDHRDGNRDLQVIRQQVALEQLHEGDAAERSETATDHDGLHDAQHRVPCRIATCEIETLEHEHGEHRADRIDRDAFPREDGAGATARVDVAQERQHDRRSADDQDRAEQQRHLERQAGEVVAGHGAERPRDDGAHRDEPHHDPPVRAQVRHA